MTITPKSFADMTSGECRWVGRCDLHVYCLRPAGTAPTFKLLTADDPPDVWQPDGWTTGVAVAVRINAILAADAA